MVEVLNLRFLIWVIFAHDIYFGKEIEMSVLSIENIIDKYMDKFSSRVPLCPVVRKYSSLLYGRIGGWTNPLISDWFADYARVVYSLFGDRVRTWITINEPIIVCSLGYGMGIMAPGYTDPGFSSYLCSKYILLAHAKAYRVYDEEFRGKYHGKVTLANHLIWFEALSPEFEDLAELTREYGVGMYSHPIFSKEGGWPRSIEKLIAVKSKQAGFVRSRLPDFTEDEVNLVQGTYDYYAVNHYTSRLIRSTNPGEVQKEWLFFGAPELNVTFVRRSDWPLSASNWFWVNPEGIRKQLVWLKQKYGDMEYLITENGYSSDGSEELNDVDRVQYYKDYMKQVLLAIKVDGVNVTGYTAWSLIDNFEWCDGYTRKFGLYQVDFKDPNRERTARHSAKYYADVIAAHSLDVTKRDNFV